MRYDDLPLKAKDGTNVEVEFVSNLYRTTSSDSMIQCNIRNISERFVAAKTTKDLENKFDQIANIIEEVFFISTKNFQVIYLNQAFEKIWGIPVDSVLKNSKVWTETILPEDRKKYFALAEENVKKGINFSAEYRIKRHDGQIRNIKVRVVCVKNKKGMVDSIAGIAYDVTKEKEDERKIKNILAQYEAATEGSLIGLSVAQNGVLKFVNKAFLKIFGYSIPEEVLGKPWEIIATEKGQKQILESRAEDRMQGRGLGTEYRFEGQKKDGTAILINVSSTPSMFEDSPAVIASLEDVTKSEKDREKAEVLDQMKNKFIQIVSHQMRTPLTSVRWSIERLLGGEIGGKLSQEHEDIIRVIYNSNLSIIEKLNDLILSLDIENNFLRLEKEKITLRSVIDSVLIELKPMISIKQLIVDFNPLGEKYFINADPSKIRQAIKKIIDNAIRYSHDGGRVAILLSKKEGYVCITVNDSGIGISKSEQESIFEKFFRASNAAVIFPDASGLGLFIAKNIIELHGGKIWFDSKEGTGSNFYLKLPLVEI